MDDTGLTAAPPPLEGPWRGVDAAPEVPPLPSPPRNSVPLAASTTGSPSDPPAGVPLVRVPGRILGIDVARGVAIIGMVMVHFGPFQPDVSTLAGWLYRLSHGKASILFVLLAGLGVSLLAGDGSAARTRRTYAQLALRVVVFLPLGLLLQALDTPVAVILQYYAMYYVVGILLFRLPTGVLSWIGGAWLIVGPLVFLGLRIADPDGVGLYGGVTTDPSALLPELWLTGIYPVVTWGAPFAVGMAMGRLDLRRTGTRMALLLGGSGFAALAYTSSWLLRLRVGTPELDQPTIAHLVLSEGHSGMPFNVVGATALAVTLLAASLLVVDQLPRLFFPFVAFGQMALTVYVGHLFWLALTPSFLEARDDVLEAWWKVGRFTLIAVVVCTLYRLRFRRGPLEALLHLPFRSAHRPSLPVAAGARRG